MIMSFIGLGMFCGPVMDLAAQWSKSVPGGMVALTTVTIAFGVVLFTHIEDMDQVDAAYMSFITGTTIGYVVGENSFIVSCRRLNTYFLLIHSRTLMEHNTTHRFGDVTPSTDVGKIAVALYAILVINVVGGLLQPAGDFLERLCHKTVPATKNKDN